MIVPEEIARQGEELRKPTCSNVFSEKRMLFIFIRMP